MRAAAIVLGVVLAVGLSSCGGGDNGGGSSATQPPTATASGGSATGFGGYVQNFGAEASGADRAAIENALEDFYSGSAAADGAKVCSTLTTGAQKSVVQSFGNSKQLQGAGCADVYTAELAKVPPRARKLNSGVVVTGARVKGARGYVIFKSAILLPSELPLRREGGVWKIDSVAASPLQ